MWLATTAITGAVIMSLEIAAFRLYAPYFGYSIYVWGSMISVVMAALTMGYAAGGPFGERGRSDLPLYSLILSSAVYQLVIVWTAPWLLPRFARYGDFAGTSLATLVIFAPSMMALAIAGPFVIRLLARAGAIGATAGKVYAMSTAGGIGGILATSLFLVPRFGTQATLLIACGLSAVTGMIGITARRGVALLALIPIALIPIMMIIRVPQRSWPANTLWARESPYNLVRVAQSGSRRLLVLNDQGSVHTIRSQASEWTGYYYDAFALGPLLVDARRALVLGMGAGQSIATARAAAPDLEIDAVEIDPEVVEAGARFFDLPTHADWLHIHVADARRWLAQVQSRYDLVQVDLYQGGPYIPFYLATVEFFESVRAHMNEDGLLMMNVFDVNPNRELLTSIAATLKRVFPSVMVLPIGSSNHIVFAFSREQSISSIRDQLNRAPGGEVFSRLARTATRRMAELDAPDGTLVFTDDHAPIEEITRRMIANAGNQ